MRFLVLLLVGLVWALPWPAHAHGELAIRLEAPSGPGNVVERGTPAVVRWSDPDLGDAAVTLYVRPTPPPPYVASWPLGEIEGTPVYGPVALADGANEATIDTGALAPGLWFVWAAVRAADGHTQYVPPAGVLTVIEPGETPPPSIWFSSPQRNATASGGLFEAVYSTWPESGVEVELLGSIEDLAGERLARVAAATPGSAQRVRVETRCSGGTGWFTLGGIVRDAAGRTGRALATGRVLSLAAAPEGTCGAGDGGSGSAGGGGCASGGGAPGASAGVALVLLFVRERRRRRRCTRHVAAEALRC